MSGATTATDPTTSPSRVGRLLDLVRKLIDYGKELAATLRQPSADDLVTTTRSFGTNDIALILARIMRGLERAGALEARLLRNAARLDKPPRRRTAPARAESAAVPRYHASQPADLRRAELPTPEQIAADIRRRPIGVVIADICRDLGIMPSHELWPELRDLIIRHGGNLARLVKDILDRVLPFAIPDDATFRSVYPPSPSPAGTGPP